jgi:hypothetical protein
MTHLDQFQSFGVILESFLHTAGKLVLGSGVFRWIGRLTAARMQILRFFSIAIAVTIPSFFYLVPGFQFQVSFVD